MNGQIYDSEVCHCVYPASRTFLNSFYTLGTYCLRYFLGYFFVFPKGFCSGVCGGLFPARRLALLKVSKSRKKNMLSLILPKNERWGIFMYWKMPQRSFFGRIQDAIICFRDLLTFTTMPAGRLRSTASRLFIRLSVCTILSVRLYFWSVPCVAYCSDCQAMCGIFTKPRNTVAKATL